MATYYMDPTRSTNGSGSFASPYNTWVGVTISAGNVYLQKEGTTFVGSVTIPVGATGVTLGSYDRASGAMLSDPTRRALIDGTGTQLTVRVREGAHNAVIDSLEVFGTDTSTERWAFYLGNTAAQPANGTVLRNCLARDVEPSFTNDGGGVKFFGSDVRITDLVVRNVPTDGIWGQGNNAVIERANISGIGNDERAFGDCIQIFGNATLGCANAQIRDCYLDHRGGSYKQVVIVQDQTGASVGCVIERNTLLMAPYDGNNSNIIFIEVPKAVVRANYCKGGNYGIYLSDADAFVVGNVVADSSYGIDQGSTETGGKVHNNTVLRCTQYAIYADTDTTFRAYNNMIVQCANGIGIETGALEDYNLFSEVPTARVSLGGAGPTWGANDQFIGDISDRVNADYSLKTTIPIGGVPMPNPLRNAGTYVQGVTLRNGRTQPGMTPIGAYQVGRY